MINQTAKQILDSAEGMMREGGYHAFSFREIATVMSIKSASVHYHFPTKEALGKAVAERYLGVFLETLGAPETVVDPIEHYAETFRHSMEVSGRPCLCGILAAESGRLPASIQGTLKDFQDQNVHWLETAFKNSRLDWKKKRRRKMAAIVFSAIEGAMIFACLRADPEHLTRVGDSLRELLDD